MSNINNDIMINYKINLNYFQTLGLWGDVFFTVVTSEILSSVKAKIFEGNGIQT